MIDLYQSANMEWTDEETLALDGARFLVTFNPDNYSVKSTLDRFLLLKAKEQIEEYIKLARDLQVKRIFELGIWQGGSVVLFEKLFKPERVVAIDWEAPLPVLQDYIHQKGLEERIRPFFHVNQGDRKRLQEILDAEFPNQELDLVVDDASHMLEETRNSFNVLFPRLRPGGVFIIEDWGWEHWQGMWQTAQSPFRGKQALTNLIFEIVMTAATDRSIVANVSIWNNMVQVRRGPRALGADFDISRSYLIHNRASFAPVFGDCDQPTIAIARGIQHVARRLPLVRKLVRAVAQRRK